MNLICIWKIWSCRKAVSFTGGRSFSSANQTVAVSVRCCDEAAESGWVQQPANEKTCRQNWQGWKNTEGAAHWPLLRQEHLPQYGCQVARVYERTALFDQTEIQTVRTGSDKLQKGHREIPCWAGFAPSNPLLVRPIPHNFAIKRTRSTQPEIQLCASGLLGSGRRGDQLIFAAVREKCFWSSNRVRSGFGTSKSTKNSYGNLDNTNEIIANIRLAIVFILQICYI